MAAIADIGRSVKLVRAVEYNEAGVELELEYIEGSWLS